MQQTQSGVNLLVGVSVHFMMCVMWDFDVLLFHNATIHITHTLHTQSQLITTHIMNTAQSDHCFLKKVNFHIFVTYGSTMDTSQLVCNLCPFKIHNEWLASLEVIFFTLACIVYGE